MASTDYRGIIMSWFEAQVDEIRDTGKNAVQETTQEGAELVRRYISTRGTAKSGKQGRIETGAMLNSVDDQIVTESRDEIVGRFGMGDAPEYAVFQEYGTSTIEAMYAITDAAEQMGDKFIAAVRRGI